MKTMPNIVHSWNHPKREEPTIYQDLANKFKEHGKVLSQVEHHRGVVNAQLKLQKT